jgi:hypothetical protein
VEIDLALVPLRLQAVQVFGFDTLRQCYTASWRDDFSTWSVDASGPPLPDAPDRLVLRGTLVDASDAAGRPFRLEFDLATADRATVTIHDTVAGAERLVQKQEWVRR